MIYVGIDDTDTLDTPGTNQLARALVARVASLWEPIRITRHQLFFDPRVPYTSKNGSASILLRRRGSVSLDESIREFRAGMQEWFKAGSDPGLCVTPSVPPEVIAFGRHAQQEIVTQQQARDLARENGIHLEGLGGTEDGVIGALAAVGLAATGDDGRVVHLGDWPDNLSGPQPITMLHQRGVEVRRHDTGDPVARGVVDVGKHLRPNMRGGKIVLFVTAISEPETPDDPDWEAIRLV